MRPVTLNTPAVSGYECALIMAAADASQPLTPTALTLSGGGRERERRLSAYVRAGFLIAKRQGRHTTYVITPAGRELADQLRRLENARES